jgi:hypothetical protein
MPESPGLLQRCRPVKPVPLSPTFPIRCTIPRMNKVHFFSACLVAILLAGCESDIRPIRAVRHVEVWVPDENATATQPATQLATTEPATAPATQTAATSQPTTLAAHVGEHKIVKIIDPNQTSRFVYKADYDNIWQQAMVLLNRTGFLLDRKDYRLGILTTQPLASPQLVEVWKPDQTTAKNAIEDTMHSQQRKVRLTISPVADKPDFYEIAIQVLVERQSNPAEGLGGLVFIEGSGFGRSQASLRSDYTPPIDIKKIAPQWYVVGHDPDLEHKLLRELFNHI